MDWNNQYVVGIHEIDEQHKMLVEHVSAVERAVSQGDRWATVHSALVRLAGVANVHFCVEESLMRIHDYPRLDEHVNEHRGFADRVRALQEHALKAGVSHDMVKFLRNWVERHIPCHDKPYALHCLRRTALGERQSRLIPFPASPFPGSNATVMPAGYAGRGAGKRAP